MNVKLVKVKGMDGEYFLLDVHVDVHQLDKDTREFYPSGKSMALKLTSFDYNLLKDPERWLSGISRLLNSEEWDELDDLDREYN